MKTIPLTQGMIAWVDDDDFPFLSKLTWHAVRREPDGTWYAATNGIVGGTSQTLLMHRMILGFPILEVDHADTNGLNNQRSNLRKATKTQNQQNQLKPVTPKTSQFKGVSKTRFGWVAHIGLNRRTIHLGSFRTEVDAALAYNEAARKHFGEFARLNCLECP